MWIAQLSDPHVRPAGQRYKGVVDANAALAAAVAQVNALRPLPDLVLLTGDVVEAGAAEEYAAASAILAALVPPLLAIPGNHDARAGFRSAFRDRPWLPPEGPVHYVVDDAGPVRVIGFDVTVPGLHHGLADAAGLAWLERTLAADPGRPCVVMLHQPPFACGVPYLDRYRCFGEEALAAVIARHPAVERVLCGHVHRHMQMRFGGTLACAAPSTATAIALRPVAEAAPASFLEPPGFLLHHWEPKRGMLTHAIPVGTFPGPFPFA
ncbi:MAG: metallophosphoesterase [Rhodospirillales bacterium]|nr:metallophosphoesterase [Rhodospirillales bacterium]MBN8896658.1 metallophosphoesterase [Rhodospirillales bacterium]